MTVRACSSVPSKIFAIQSLPASPGRHWSGIHCWSLGRGAESCAREDNPPPLLSGASILIFVAGESVLLTSFASYSSLCYAYFLIRFAVPADV